MLCLVLASCAWGQSSPTPAPQPPAPKPPAVVFPEVNLPNPPAPLPPPAPTPGSSLFLKPGVSYVITSSSPVAVLASPLGVVSIDATTGPLRISGIFSDGKGARETRTYTQPNLYIVETTGAGGECDILVIRSLADRTGDIRQAITTSAPPPPPPPPNPVDPITQAMADALKADGQPASVAATLAKVYRSAALGVASSTDKIYGPVTTYGTLFTILKPIQDAAVPPLTIPHLRSVVGQQFASALGATQADPINRTLAANTFNGIAQKLEGVK